MRRRTGRAAALVTGLAVIGTALGAWSSSGPGPADAEAATGEVRSFALVAKSTTLTVDKGVFFKAFTFNDRSPGPQIVVNEGDTVELTIRNEDSITHGLSVHAANTQTSKFVGNVAAGKTGKLTFKADYPGVYMYHCAPGGHGIMTHTMGGMYGMIVVEPTSKKYRLEQELGRAPDVKVYVVQQEVYANGRDFFDGKPLYVMFNGRNFRYVTDPIKVRPGNYVLTGRDLGDLREEAVPDHLDLDRVAAPEADGRVEIRGADAERGDDALRLRRRHGRPDSPPPCSATPAGTPSGSRSGGRTSTSAVSTRT